MTKTRDRGPCRYVRGRHVGYFSTQMDSLLTRVEVKRSLNNQRQHWKNTIDWLQLQYVRFTRIETARSGAYLARRFNREELKSEE